jgi:hypothetical protein
MKFSGKGKQEIDFLCIIPFILYLYKGKVYDQTTIYKGKEKYTGHTGYCYGISITPCFQIQIAHGSLKKKG